MPTLIQLRQLLREKFPGLRTRADELPPRTRPVWPTGVPSLDERLGHGFPKGALSEIVSPRRTCGTALLIAHLLEHAAVSQQFTALVDGQDSFDPGPLLPATLERLLWLRCHNAEEALKAADLVVRDGNLPLVLIDLALVPDAQLRKVPSPTWYRFQRIVEERNLTVLVFTPRAMVSPAVMRVDIETRFTLDALNEDPADLLHDLEIEVNESRRHFGEDVLERTA